MNKIEGIDYVLASLKDRLILTTNGKNRFILSKDRVICLFDSNSIKMSIEDFIVNYKKEIFYEVEDNGVYIDDSKDEDYYRYYKK